MVTATSNPTFEFQARTAVGTTLDADVQTFYNQAFLNATRPYAAAFTGGVGGRGSGVLKKISRDNS